MSPQKYWKVNNPTQLTKVLDVLESIRAEFNGQQNGGKKISMADLIVLAGNAVVEEAANAAGKKVTISLPLAERMPARNIPMFIPLKHWSHLQMDLGIT